MIEDYHKNTALSISDIDLFENHSVNFETLKEYGVEKSSVMFQYKFPCSGKSLLMKFSSKGIQYEFMTKNNEFLMFGFDKLPFSHKKLIIASSPLELLQLDTCGEIALFLKNANNIPLHFFNSLYKKFEKIEIHQNQDCFTSKEIDFFKHVFKEKCKFQVSDCIIHENIKKSNMYRIPI